LEQQLGGELPVLELPSDRPRPAVQTFNGARKWLALPEQLTQSLQALSQGRKAVTLFITLLAIFKSLAEPLHRRGRRDCRLTDRESTTN